MEKILSIVNPQRRGVVDDDRELLLELLKEERKTSKARMEHQRRKIVELTAKVNEHTALSDGGCKHEELLEHLSEMEENARMLTKTIDLHEQAVRERQAMIEQKNVQIGALQKQLQEAKSQLARFGDDMQQIDDEANRMLQATIDKQAVEIADLSAEVEKQNALIKDLRKERQSSSGRLNTLQLMVDYAKANGFKFMRCGDMKNYIIEQAAQEDNAKTLVDVFGEMDADIAEFSTALGACVDDDDDNEFSVGLSGHMYKDAVAMDKQKCPFGVEQKRKTPAIVGGIYCRKKCPYNDGIDQDQNIVHCSKKQ